MSHNSLKQNEKSKKHDITPLNHLHQDSWPAKQPITMMCPKSSSLSVYPWLWYLRIFKLNPMSLTLPYTPLYIQADQYYSFGMGDDTPIHKGLTLSFTQPWGIEREAAEHLNRQTHRHIYICEAVMTHKPDNSLFPHLFWPKHRRMTVITVMLYEVQLPLDISSIAM